MVRVGRQIFVRTTALYASFLVAASVLARMGDAELGAHQIAFELCESAVVFGRGHDSEVSSGVQSWGPQCDHRGMEGQDSGERSFRGRQPETRTQDPLASSAAAVFGPRISRADG